MCGIVGAIARRDVPGILLEGLKRLEYRGYDSAGLAVIPQGCSRIERRRRVGKVKELTDSLRSEPLFGHIGIAHTRWATHGAPLERNAHPHMSRDRICVVHNGIIENFEQIRQKLKTSGYQFDSDTDSEVIARMLIMAPEPTWELRLRSVMRQPAHHSRHALACSTPDRASYFLTSRGGWLSR